MPSWWRLGNGMRISSCESGHFGRRNQELADRLVCFHLAGINVPAFFCWLNDKSGSVQPLELLSLLLEQKTRPFLK